MERAKNRLSEEQREIEMRGSRERNDEIEMRRSGEK